MTLRVYTGNTVIPYIDYYPTNNIDANLTAQAVKLELKKHIESINYMGYLKLSRKLDRLTDKFDYMSDEDLLSTIDFEKEYNV